MELLNFLVWMTRVVGGIIIVDFAYKAYKVVDEYNSNLDLAESAVQASQLSGEQLLVAASSIGVIIAVAVIMVVMELIHLSYTIKHAQQSVEAVPHPTTGDTIVEVTSDTTSESTTDQQ
jgi:hypothetical protein